LIKLLVAGIALVGCASPHDDFVAGRVQDSCDQAWPVCATVAGCYIGAESFVEGNFPGTQKVVVTLQQPSTVKVRVLLDTIASSGTETRVDFFEGGCQARAEQVATGIDFADESERIGEFDRQADLTDLGDHLIQITSDAQASYTFEVEVIPKQNTGL
jgi:hypothetical protein